jgi:hypothetical protein
VNGSGPSLLRHALVGASDLGWLRELLAGRELAAAAGREAQLGIDARLLARAEHIAVEALSSQGPSTPADLARWANLTAADTRLAVAAARPHLAALTVDDTEYLLGPDTQDELASCRKAADGVIALPGFDEMIFGYRDRTPTLPDDRGGRVFPHRNGVPSCTVIIDGQVAATWRRPAKRPGETIEITPLVPLTEQIMRSAARKASALT